jgi:hypothetical protein
MDLRSWARHSSGALIVAGSLGLLGGCYRTGAATPPPPPSPPGSPLPAGWAWPFAPQESQQAVRSWSVLRPFDVASVSRLQGSGPGAPAQVAPNVWVSLLTSGLPRLAASPAVPVRAPFQDRAQQATPDQVDLRAVGLDGPVKNQQMVGVCWSFAISTLMDNALRRAGRQEVMAPLHVIAAGTWDEIFQLGHGTHELVTEPSWPYDPPKACELEDRSDRGCESAYHVRQGSWRQDPSLSSEVTRAGQEGAFRIVKVEQLSLRPLDTGHMASILAGGQAIYLGMDINSDAWSRSSQGQIADWSATDGAHGVAIVGYRTAGNQRQFLVHNSWGTTWAAGGYAWVSEAMVRAHTHEAFVLDVVGPHGQTLPTSTKLPAPQGGGQGFPLPSFPWPFPQTGAGQPAGNACAAGQVRDLLRGVCVAPCASGGPPTAGLCPAGPMPGPGGFPWLPGGSPAGPQTGAQPGPAASGCAAGQVHDLLTGQCAGQCASGLPPTGGACMPWGR